MEQLTTSGLQPESERPLEAAPAPSGDEPPPLNPTEAQSSESDDTAPPTPVSFEEQVRQQQGESRAVDDDAGTSDSEPLAESPAEGYRMAPGMNEIIQGASRMQGLTK